MDLMNLFGDLVTEEVKRLVRERILSGGNLAARKNLPKATVKLALLIIRHLNPDEEITDGERAFLMGIAPNTLTKIRSERRFIHVVNR